MSLLLFICNQVQFIISEENDEEIENQEVVIESEKFRGEDIKQLNISIV